MSPTWRRRDIVHRALCFRFPLPTVLPRDQAVPLALGQLDPEGADRRKAIEALKQRMKAIEVGT